MEHEGRENFQLSGSSKPNFFRCLIGLSVLFDYSSVWIIRNNSINHIYLLCKVSWCLVLSGTLMSFGRCSLGRVTFHCGNSEREMRLGLLLHVSLASLQS